MSGAEADTGQKWTFGVRVISNQIDRARWRNTLTYRFHPRLTAGVEYNSLAGKVTPIANFVALTETHRRPAVRRGWRRYVSVLRRFARSITFDTTRMP